MFGVSSRVVLECALTEPGLEMIARLLNHLIEERKQKKLILRVISIFSQKKGFCPMVKNTYTDRFQRESRKCCWGKFSLQILLCNSEHNLKRS